MRLSTKSGTLRTKGGTLRGLALAATLVPELPFAMPSRAAMSATGKDVMAYFHTFPIYPQTSGSTNYGDWLLPASAPTIGGRWRQRPYPFIEGTLTHASRVAHAKEDIRVASNIGIDCFTFNILSGYIGGADWTDRVLAYYDAAAGVLHLRIVAEGEWDEMQVHQR